MGMFSGLYICSSATVGGQSLGDMVFKIIFILLAIFAYKSIVFPHCTQNAFLSFCVELKTSIFTVRAP